MIKLLTLLAVLIASPVWAQVAYVTSQTATETGQDTAVSLSIDVGAGSNRLLVCGAHWANGTNTVTGITHNSVALTEADAIDIGGAFLGVWYLVAPDSGSQTVTATWSGSGSNKLLGCFAFTGAHQTNPVTVAGNFASTANPSTITVTVPVNGMAAAFNTNGETADAGSFTVDAASTERYDLADTDGNFAAIASTKDTAETAAMTFSNTAGNYSAMIAVTINPTTASRQIVGPVVFQ